MSDPPAQVESLTNAAWKRLFEHFGIAPKLEEREVFRITAKQISSVAKREPRLMAKFDSSASRPRILRDHGVTILPTSNGEYVLLRGDGYCKVPAASHIELYDASRLDRLQTVPFRSGIHSESQAIDVLFLASVLRTFADDGDLSLTVRGRIRSSAFSFEFRTVSKTHPVQVDGVQIELDSGFEGQNVVLLEAKFGTINDFLVRQLYYPYRNFLELGVQKRIVPVLLVYSNKVYSLYEFGFEEVNLYQSIRLIRQVDYSLEQITTVPAFREVVRRGRSTPPPDVPFPQADDVSKVIDLAELLHSGPLRKNTIADAFDVDPRQGDYYANAARWVGLVERRNGLFDLTPEGKGFVRMNRTERIVWLAERVSGLPVFHEAAQAVAQGDPLSNTQIVRLIGTRFRLEGSTLPRRALTVAAWIQWLATNLRP
jgi:hypothetical protein